MQVETDHKPGVARKNLLWPDWRRRKRMLYVEAWVFVAGAYAMLMPARLWPQEWGAVSERAAALHWVFFMVEVFTDHIGMVLAIIIGVALWRGLWNLALVAAPIMLLTFGPVAWGYVPGFKPSADGPDIMVMSVNLLLVNTRYEAILTEIRDADPDLVLFQEYTHEWHAALERGLAEAYPFRVVKPQDDAFGAAIYARLPFVSEPNLMFAGGTSELPQIRVVVDASGRHIAVYNVHLLPPVRLEYVIARHAQFADMLKAIEGEKLPIILGGDFNFTKTSPHARALARVGLRDVHDEASWGRGATWPVNGIHRYLPIPGLRLDHIYIRDPLLCLDARTGVGSGSDHRPVTATLGLRGVNQ